MIRAKAVPSRLDPLSYENLRQQILRRDGWRCQSCGTLSNLEVHHRKFRSRSGADSKENLITLCAACHARVHGRKTLLPTGLLSIGKRTFTTCTSYTTSSVFITCSL
jgi:5-methylcytosine-specific restriction endonuclease McrA